MAPLKNGPHLDMSFGNGTIFRMYELWIMKVPLHFRPSLEKVARVWIIILVHLIL